MDCSCAVLVNACRARYACTPIRRTKFNAKLASCKPCIDTGLCHTCLQIPDLLMCRCTRVASLVCMLAADTLNRHLPASYQPRYC